MLPAVQRAFQVDELFRWILAELQVLDPSRKSCLSVAMTCSQFYGPAMDVCWSRVEDVNWFRNCLHSGSCLCDSPGQDRDSQLQSRKNPISSSLPHHEIHCLWNRTYDLSRRVRKLVIDNRSLQEIASVTIDPVLALGQSLFPGLRELSWRANTWSRMSAETFLDLAKCLIQPSLLRCELLLSRSVHGPELSRFVVRLVTLAPHLEELIIKSPSYDSQVEALAHHASSQVRSKDDWHNVWPALRILDVSNITLPKPLIRSLYTATNLSELRLQVPNLTSFRGQEHACLPALRVLSVQHETRTMRSRYDPPGYDEGMRKLMAVHLVLFLQSISTPGLKEVVLQVTRIVAGTLQSIASAISDRLLLQKIEFSVVFPDEDYHFGPRKRYIRVVDFAELSPLYRLSSLRSLKITGPPVRLHGCQIAELGEAWPQLQTLKFEPLMRIRRQTSLSISDFPLLSMHCPNLSALSVLFDPSNCPRELPKSHNQPRKHITVDASSTWVESADDARAIDAFLRGVFPGCELFSPWVIRKLDDEEYLQDDYSVNPPPDTDDDIASVWSDDY